MWRKDHRGAHRAAGFGTVAVARPAGPHQAAHVQRAQAFVIKAKVARIVDGDTLVARYKNRTDRVRLIGINTPEIGQCYATEATAAARSLAAGRKVRLIGDPTQAKRDRFGRLLAYVVLPNGHDLGRDLIRLGGRGLHLRQALRAPEHLPCRRSSSEGSRLRALDRL
jgi:endonuclease YncB( thermonuclease family)